MSVPSSTSEEKIDTEKYVLPAVTKGKEECVGIVFVFEGHV